MIAIISFFIVFGVFTNIQYRLIIDFFNQIKSGITLTEKEVESKFIYRKIIIFFIQLGMTIMCSIPFNFILIDSQITGMPFTIILFIMLFLLVLVSTSWMIYFHRKLDHYIESKTGLYLGSSSLRLIDSIILLY